MVSQGVDLTGAADYQLINNAGEGVKVGVIAIGFVGYANSQASGALPATLSVADYSGTGTVGTSHW